MKFRHAWAVGIALTVSAACSNDVTRPNPTGIRIIAGAKATDTIDARLAKPLVVEVRDSTGALVPGVTVSFESTIRDCPEPGYGIRSCPSAFVASSAEGGFSTLAALPTDAVGQASAFVQLGDAEGTADVVVSVPEFKFVDTATFTVRHGAAVAIAVSPYDTTVRPGARYGLQVQYYDMHYNVWPATATFTGGAGVSSISSTGQVAAGLSIARSDIAVRAGKYAHTVHVSIVPPLPLVGLDPVGYFGFFVYVVSVNADGTGKDTVATIPSATLPNGRSFPFPSVGGTPGVVAFHRGDPARDAVLQIVSLTGGAVTTFGQANGFAMASFPTVSPDGQWIYFIGRRTGAPSLWRLHVGSSDVDSLTAGPNNTLRVTAPAISPDGAIAVLDEGTETMFIRVATRETWTMPVICGMPRFSPDGSRLACLARLSNAPAALFTMNVDGSDVRTLGPSDWGFDEMAGVDWSPDGQWLVAGLNAAYASVGGPLPVLLNAMDGRAVPLSSLGATRVSFVR